MSPRFDESSSLRYYRMASNIIPSRQICHTHCGFSQFRSDKVKNQKFQCSNINPIHKSKNASKRLKIALAACNLIPSKQICHTHCGFSQFRSDKVKNRKFQCANMNQIHKSKNAWKRLKIALAASNIIPSRQICHTQCEFSQFRSEKS